MDDVKQVYRETKNTTKEQVRKIDGESPADKVGNLGDDVRDTLGNAGDKLGNAGDKVADQTERPTTDPYKR